MKKSATNAAAVTTIPKHLQQLLVIQYTGICNIVAQISCIDLQQSAATPFLHSTPLEGSISYQQCIEEAINVVWPIENQIKFYYPTKFFGFIRASGIQANIPTYMPLCGFRRVLYVPILLVFV